MPTLTALYLARAQLGRLQGSSLGLRLGVAAGGAFLFALLMIIPALLTGDLNAAVGQAFGYGLLWGLVGALTGTVLAAPPTGAERRVPARGRTFAGAALTALRPLGLALLVTTALGTAIWIVNVATDGDTRGSRSLPIALVDTALYAVDHGVHTFELGTLAAFERRALEPAGAGAPAPRGGPRARSSATAARRSASSPTATALSAVVFLLMLVVLIGIPLTAALYAGFLVARERAAARPLLGAAWGALVGPVWAIVLAILNGAAPGHAVRPRPGRERVRDRAGVRRADRRRRRLPRRARERYAARRRLTPNPTSPPSARPSTIAIPSSPEPPPSAARRRAPRSRPGSAVCGGLRASWSASARR